METDNESKHSSKDTEHNETCDSAAEGSIQPAFKVVVKTLIGPKSILRGHNFHISACMYMLYSYMLVSYALAVVQEGPEATAVEVIQDRQQEMLVKLEGCRELRDESDNSKTESVI